MIGTCARCGEQVAPDPLEETPSWRCTAGHEPLLGTPVVDPQTVWDGVRRRRKDFVDLDLDLDEDAALDVVVPPEVEMLPMDPDDAALPKTARSMARLATEHGWEVLVTYSRGTPLAANGKSIGVKVKEMRLNEVGDPEMSPTGKPRFRMVPTGEPLVIDVIVLRMRRRGDRLVASWEDGKLDLCLRADPLTVLNNTTIREAITS